MPAKENLINQQFGRLAVIEECEHLNGRVAWLCKCSCGNFKKVTSKSLKDGNTKSCGCLQKETLSKIRMKDLTNQTFGKLTALKPTKERVHGSVVWECKCECGNTHYASAELLLAKKVQSCGCIRSLGNAKVAKILESMNLLFVKEYPIRVNKINYYYDFAILNEDSTLKCIIEYDGILHFSQDSYHGWNNEENWLKTKKNDEIKNQWCKDNNVKLIRIPYTDYDKINWNYIKERMDN